MKNLIITHGENDLKKFLAYKNFSLNINFIPWVPKELCKNNTQDQASEMLTTCKLVYEEWMEFFENFKVKEDIILIGYSCIRRLIIRYLNEKNIQVRKFFDCAIA